MNWWPFRKPKVRPTFDVAAASNVELVYERDRLAVLRNEHIDGVHTANAQIAVCETELKRRFLQTRQVNVLPSYGSKKVKNETR